MATINNWAISLKGMTADRLAEINEAFEILEDWDLFETSYPEMKTIRVLVDHALMKA